MDWNDILNWIKWIMIWNECGFKKIWYFDILNDWNVVLKTYDILIYLDGLKMEFWKIWYFDIKMIWKEDPKDMIFWNDLIFILIKIWVEIIFYFEV